MKNVFKPVSSLYVSPSVPLDGCQSQVRLKQTVLMANGYNTICQYNEWQEVLAIATLALETKKIKQSGGS